LKAQNLSSKPAKSRVSDRSKNSDSIIKKDWLIPVENGSKDLQQKGQAIYVIACCLFRNKLPLPHQRHLFFMAAFMAFSKDHLLYLKDSLCILS